MTDSRRLSLGTVLALVCALSAHIRVHASGVPISGFYPMMGLSLTNDFDDSDNYPFSAYAVKRTSMVGAQLGAGGAPFYDVALLDSGAAISLLNADAAVAFNIEGAGFGGTNTLPVGGATGTVETIVNDPLGMYLTGLSNRTSTAPLAFNTATMVGQSSVSLVTLPEESTLPNVIGIPFISQFATFIRNDQPQIFQLNGKTVRSPQIQLLPRGTGNQQGIVRNQTLTLNSDAGFSSQTPPTYIPDFLNILDDLPLADNPTVPTILQAPGALFMNVIVDNQTIPESGPPIGPTLGVKQFFFDTGADVTVLSTDNAALLGIDPLLTPPDFTVAVEGSGGTSEGVPGYYVKHLTLPMSGGFITAENVPVLVLDIPNPTTPGVPVEGILGTNVFAGRNVVIDPNPQIESGGAQNLGGPKIYVSDPVTTARSWGSSATSANWATSGSWTAAGTPGNLWIANVRNTGSAKEAVVSADSTVWEVNIAGATPNSMTVRIQDGVRLTTFSGTNIETGGRVQLEGGTLDAQFVDVRGGTLTGSGSVMTGSGPIAGQVENHGGVVAPGNGVGTLNISGRFVNSFNGTLAMDLGGTMVGTQYDQLVVDGAISLDGTLSVSLANLGLGMFAPVLGSDFTLVTATGEIGGTFDNLSLPGGYSWNVAYNPSSVVLSVTGVGTPGDFNSDGKVDAADYVVWRKTGGTQQQYQDWRTNFGAGTGSASGSGVGTSASVPEPASAFLVVAAAGGFALRRRARVIRPARC